MNDERALFWRSAAKRLARRVNLGWWLDRWTPWLLACALLGALAVLAARVITDDASFAWWGLGAALAVGAVYAWWISRPQFETEEAARVRLEDSLGLKARLSSAAQGVGEWPAVPTAEVPSPLRSRWERALSVVVVSALMLCLASWAPISRQAFAPKRTIEKPSAVAEVEAVLEKLREKDAAAEESLEDVEKKIAELTKRPAEDWYEHGSLEAAAHLQEQTADYLRELSKNLAEAERSAAALSAGGEGLPQQAKNGLSDALQSALQGLRDGDMKPNGSLQESMDGMGSEAGNLTPEQMKKLAEALKKNSQALRDALENSPELQFSEQACPG